jgi:putative transposase
MARQLRVEYPGAIYHVTCRMVGAWKAEKTALFKDDADRERFVERLSERVEQFHIRLYQFVCMTNHFHLVFETPEANCSKFMQSLSTAYTVYYNLRHDRHGHLFDGRFKAKLVEGDDYLLALSRYVHLNPVQVVSMKDKPIEERIKYLRFYRWSSYPGYIGQCKALDFVDYGPLLGEMAGKRRERPKRYRQFVESGLAESDADFKAAMKESPRSIGSDGFRAWIAELYQKRIETHARPEDVSFRHITEPLPAKDVLAVLIRIFAVEETAFFRRGRSSALRAVAAYFLIRCSGLSQRDAAKMLNIGSGAAVCNQLKSLPDKLKDRGLRKTFQKADDELRKLRKDHCKKA